MFTFADIVSRSAPWYVFAGASAGAAIVLVTAITVILCFLKRRRKKRHGDKEEATSRAKSNKDFNFSNPAYASCSDLK